MPKVIKFGLINRLADTRTPAEATAVLSQWSEEQRLEAAIMKLRGQAKLAVREFLNDR